MLNKKFSLGILVMMLVSGLMVVGCDNDSTDNKDSTNSNFTGDTALNGTWVRWGGNSVLSFSNGNWEYEEYGTPVYKGSYTTNNGFVSAKATHLYSDHSEFINSAILIQIGLEPNKWYPMTEIKAIVGVQMFYDLALMNDMDPVTFISEISYFINGVTLHYGNAVYARQ